MQMFQGVTSQICHSRTESIKNGQEDLISREFCTNAIALFCCLFTFALSKDFPAVLLTRNYVRR